jgi:hypothetical protein
LKSAATPGPHRLLAENNEMKIVVGVLGLLVIGIQTGSCIFLFGKHWDFSGRYHMPTSLLSPDGKSYRDGSEFDPVTYTFVKWGIEQEAWLVMVGVLLMLLIASILQDCRLHRMQRKAFERELGRIREMRHVDESA